MLVTVVLVLYIRIILLGNVNESYFVNTIVYLNKSIIQVKIRFGLVSSFL